MFRRYDDLNASVQENVFGIRTVKAFVREKFENEKFKSAAENLYKLYVKAESILAVNNPVMMLVIYGCILAISWIGARFVVGGSMTTGNLTSLFSYVISMLMSLMMLSMIFVMVAMSMASFRRIMEVLRERPDLVNPPQALTQIQDGSIDIRPRVFYLPARQRELCPFGHRPAHQGRGDHRHHRRHGLRQVQPGEPDQPAVRCVPGGGEGGRQRRALLRSGNAPGQRGRGAAEERAVLRHDSGEPPLGQGGRRPGGV